MLAAHPIVFGYRTRRTCAVADARTTSTPAMKEAGCATPGRAIRDSSSAAGHRPGKEAPHAYTSGLLTK
jgi:hypothetical protein